MSLTVTRASCRCGSAIQTAFTSELEKWQDKHAVCLEQEPIGVMVSMDISKGDEPEYRIFGRIYEVQKDGKDFDEVTYLAIEDSRNFEATRQQRQPLTDEQIVELDKWLEGVPFWRVLEFTRAIEAAHGIKEKTHD